jgi:hypothetical protein
MSDERDLWADDQDQDEVNMDGTDETGSEAAPPDGDVELLSLEAFDDELEALAAYSSDAAETVEEGVLPVAGEEVAETAASPGQEPGTTGIGEAEAQAVRDDDSIRTPRAQRFRRGLRNQLGMLPLALYLLAVGGYLLARGQDVGGLPTYSDPLLMVSAVLAVGFTLIFHALVAGRRERGVLFAGVWLLVTVGMIAVLVLGIDDEPDTRRWWPLVIWSLSPALLITYLIERTHDARLILLSVIALVAGTTAYLVTSDRVSAERLDQVAEYWPLLLSVLGVGLLPLVFRRRAG